VARKIALIVAAILIPGGLCVLCIAWLGRALAQTERGRKAITFARRRVPAWITDFRAPAFRARIAA
jgi:hypothetical protein